MKRLRKKKNFISPIMDIGYAIILNIPTDDKGPRIHSIIYNKPTALDRLKYLKESNWTDNRTYILGYIEVYACSEEE